MALMQRDLERPFWLTRNQIWAFVVGSLATAALSFVGGMKFQERLSQDDEMESEEPTRLIVQEVEDDTLVALLARVEASVDGEAAEEGENIHELTYPHQLPSESIEVPVPESLPPDRAPQQVEVASSNRSQTLVPATTSSVTDLPEWNVPKEGSGVSIQCWSFSKVEDADEKLKGLLEDGYQAYRIAAALDDGKIWYRVRVGPFKSKKEAVRKVKELKSRYSLEKPFITEAP